MKALSIRQPWAWAILNAGKDIENRNWPTRYRGPIFIHAAKGLTRDEYDNFVAFTGMLRAGHGLAIPSVPAFSELTRGGIVGRADIVDCVTVSSSPWFFGAWGFVLDNIEPLPFRPIPGKLGLFEVSS